MADSVWSVEPEPLVSKPVDRAVMWGSIVAWGGVAVAVETTPLEPSPVLVRLMAFLMLVGLLMAFRGIVLGLKQHYWDFDGYDWD